MRHHRHRRHCAQTSEERIELDLDPTRTPGFRIHLLTQVWILPEGDQTYNRANATRECSPAQGGGDRTKEKGRNRRGIIALL